MIKIAVPMDRPQEGGRLLSIEGGIDVFTTRDKDAIANRQLGGYNRFREILDHREQDGNASGGFN